MYDDTTNSSGYYHKNDYQDYGQEDRHRGSGGGFPKKRLVPSEPSPHVIFLGFDPDFTEADVRITYISVHILLTHFPASSIPCFTGLQH